MVVLVGHLQVRFRTLWLDCLKRSCRDLVPWFLFVCM